MAHAPRTDGRVLGLWRYPVKSLGGESCDSLALTIDGIEGDRLYALQDADGKLGSGKDTRRFRRMDGLLSFSASFCGDTAEISLPDGSRLRADDGEANGRLSAALGREVKLVRSSPGGYVDAAPVHVLTTASLAWLRAALPDAAIDARRFRPNVLLECEGAMPIEQQWIGRTLTLGNAVLRVVAPTERCRMVTLPQGDLPDDPRVLHRLAQSADALFGVYAGILVSGVVRRGDAVRLDT